MFLSLEKREALLFLSYTLFLSCLQPILLAGKTALLAMLLKMKLFISS